MIPILLMLFFAQVNPPAQVADQAKVTFYRPSKFRGSIRAITILCDSKVVTAMENGTYYSTMLPAGKHACQDTAGGSAALFTAETGKQYYVLVDWAGTHPHLAVTDSVLLKKLKCVGEMCP